MRKDIILKLLLLSAIIFITGCNAVSGFGRDIQEAAEGTKDLFFDER